MPAVKPQERVLITGVNGFIAASLAGQYLDAGYAVHGTVRTKEKGEWLANNPRFKNKAFTWVVVDDMTSPDAFDLAAKDVAVFVHTAGPFNFSATDAASMIKSFEAGMTSVLHACRNSPTVKRLIVTGTSGSMEDHFLEPTKNETYSSDRKELVLNEEIWNISDLAQIRNNQLEDLKKQPQTHYLYSVMAYYASKTVAERLLWTFMEENKNTVSFDAVVIAPTFTLGPFEHDVADPSKLNESLSTFYNLFVPDEKGIRHPAHQGFLNTALGSFCDVRDVCRAHVLATSKEFEDDSTEKRFIVATNAFSWQTFINTLIDLKLWDKDSDANRVDPIRPLTKRFDGSKATKVLGLQYHDGAETLKITVEALRKLAGLPVVSEA